MINFLKKVISIITEEHVADLQNKIDFIKVAISDTQDTIRAIDVKSEIILAILALIMTALFTWDFHKYSFIVILEIIICVFWVIAVIYAFSTLNPKNNPMEHVKGKYSKGLFYGVSYMTNEIVDNNKLLYDIECISEKGLLKELVSDFSKLIYIRDSKIKNFKNTLKFTGITIIFFVVTFVIGIISINYDNKPKENTSTYISQNAVAKVQIEEPSQKK